MRPHLEVLPKPQKEFWDEFAGTVPAHFVLYGGTAVALRLGHRKSVDFDFFSDQGLEFDHLLTAMPSLKGATALDRKPDTVTVSMPMPSGEVKLSFFGGISFGRVGVPDRVRGKVRLASSLDLLATKLKTIHDRIEAKDYLDIEALLKSGLTLSQGIAAARSLFGQMLNPLDTAKAVGWFKDGDLDRKLSSSTRAFLAGASAKFDPRVTALPIKSKTLASAKPSRSIGMER
jgi:hypothetical protein